MADGFIVSNDRLLENGYKLLSESNFYAAQSDFDKVLQRDGTCSRAYRGIMLAKNAWIDERDAERPDAVARICETAISRVGLFELTDARIAAEVLSALTPEFDAAMKCANELDKQGLRILFERLRNNAVAYVQRRQTEERVEHERQLQREREIKRLQGKISRIEGISVFFIVASIIGAIALIIGCFVSSGSPLWTLFSGILGLSWGHTTLRIGRLSIGSAIFWGGIVGVMVLLLIVNYACSIEGQIIMFVFFAIGIVLGIISNVSENNSEERLRRLQGY
ncbi:MAG: hypothetical protein FWF10_10375 [Clostridiales bacterium]|nr:hypothetical protein [Clostridiales bacterium]